MWGVRGLQTRVTGPSGKERLGATVLLVCLHSLTHVVLPWELLATTSHAFWRRIESDFLSQSQAFLVKVMVSAPCLLHDPKAQW